MCQNQSKLSYALQNVNKQKITLSAGDEMKQTFNKQK